MLPAMTCRHWANKIRDSYGGSLALAFALLLLTIAGCSSGPTRILDSDIPTVPGMQQRLGFDIKREAGDIVGGVFVFVGPLRETEETMRALSSRFRDAGWTLDRSTQGFPRSALVFSKDSRRVEVALDADQLEPHELAERRGELLGEGAGGFVDG